MSDEIDFFKNIPEEEEKKAAANLRYQELLQLEGDAILNDVNLARSNGDLEKVKELQKTAKNKALLQLAIEFHLIGKRPEEHFHFLFTPPLGYEPDDEQKTFDDF